MQLFESKQDSVTFISAWDYRMFSPGVCREQTLNHRNSRRLQILKLPTNVKFDDMALYSFF